MPLRTAPSPPARLRPPSAPLSHFSSAKRKSKFFAIRRCAPPSVRPSAMAANLPLHTSPPSSCVLFLLFPPQNVHRAESQLSPSAAAKRGTTEQLPPPRPSLSLPLSLAPSVFCWINSSREPSTPPRPSVQGRRRAAAAATATAFLTVPSIFTCSGGRVRVSRVAAVRAVRPASPSIPPAFNICITKSASRFLGI